MSITTSAPHWSQGPFAFVEGLDAEVDIFPAWVAEFSSVDRARLIVSAAKAVFDFAPVPHHYDQTCPHPRVIKDYALNTYGIEATDAEIATATRVVMA
jgi:hypothetical protein